MKQITEKYFNDNIYDCTTDMAKLNTLTIIDFYADWCGPCKMLTPILEKLELEYGDKINIFKINADDENTLFEKFKIRSIPTLLFISWDCDIQLVIGVKSMEYLKSIIDKYL